MNLEEEINSEANITDFAVNVGKQVCSEAALEKQRNKNREIKFEVLSHYSKGQPRCACCGESELKFLSIDHVNNDGAYHRKHVTHGQPIYPWLKKNGFPVGFQVLCFNCNLAKGFFGECPHQSRKGGLD